MRIIPVEIGMDGRSLDLAAALRALAGMLNDVLGPCLAIAPAEPALLQELRSALSVPGRQHAEFEHWIRKALNCGHGADRQRVGLLVACPEHHPLALAFRASNPGAQWGGNSGRIAAAYGSYSTGVMWHEVLHVMGADECYPPTNPSVTTCEMGSSCIMSYEPAAQPVWPFLCADNMERLRQARAARWTGPFELPR